MVIADYLREKWVTPLQEKHREEAREKGRVEGREKGIDEANNRWRAWNRRRQQAETRGQPFNEPVPYSDQP